MCNKQNQMLQQPIDMPRGRHSWAGEPLQNIIFKLFTYTKVPSNLLIRNKRYNSKIANTLIRYTY